MLDEIHHNGVNIFFSMPFHNLMFYEKYKSKSNSSETILKILF